MTSSFYGTSQHIQELMGAFFEYEKAIFNGEHGNKSIIYVRMGKKNLFLAITICHHSASLVMPNSDSQDRFFCLTLMMIDYKNVS